MKRHPSLHPLSQHHHFALIQALGMRRAAEAEEGKRDAAVERQARKFLAFWHKTGELHFREEEEVLLPAYAQLAAGKHDAGVARLLADHSEIRRSVANFERRLAGSRPIETAALAGLAKLLHDHIRFEENELFPRIEKALGEENLNSMARGLTRLHSKNDVCDI